MAKKTLLVETLSFEDLEKKGYKQRENYNGWYLGNSKWPTHKIDHKHESLLGREFRILGLKNDKVLVQGTDDETYYLPMHLIKTKIKKVKAQKMIFRKDVAVFNGYSFEMPCEMRTMSEAEAIAAAKWILKVTK